MTLPILMYHSIAVDYADELTVKTEMLERQFSYIRQKGYTPIFFRDLISSQESHSEPLPKKPIIITFDDGYQNNADLLFPLLEKYDMKASIALVSKYLGKQSEWDGCNAKALMDATTANSAPKNRVEFTLHSYAHICYRHCSINDIEDDLKLAITAMKQAGIAYTPTLVYPYGAFPREKNAYKQFCAMLEHNGIAAGLRIGNRINRLPIKDKFHICRIDVKGTYSFCKFKIKLI